MKSIILKTLNARPEESTQVFLLLGQGFFTGIFLATYDVGAVSIFLEYFSEDILAWAFVASGATGIIFTYLYSYFQARVSFPKLVTGFLIIIALANGFVWYGLNFFTDFEPIVFLAFVLALPFSYIGLLIFWGSFGRMFSIAQAKRMIGGIDTGQLLASIVGLFLIGYLLDNKFVISRDLFLISLVSLLGFFILFMTISFKYNLATQAEKEKRTKTYPILKMMRNKYLRLMAIFVLISIIAATFVDFTFLNVTQTQWPQPSDLGAFIARFQAVVVIFSFLFQTFVTDYIIENYGLKISLLVNPALIILLTILAGLTGLVFTYEAGPDFGWFFIMIVVTKLFIDSLKDALDGPTFKLYFLPIDANVRFDVSTKIEGVMTAFAAMVAGLLLILMNTLNLDLIVVIFVLVPVLAGWFYITGNMHFSYKETLHQALADIKSKGFKSIYKGYKEQISGKELSESESDVYYSLKVMERMEPAVFESSLENIKSHIKANSRLDKFAQKVSDRNNTIKALAEKAQKGVESDGGSKHSNKDIYEMSKSSDINVRIAAAIQLSSETTDETVFVLMDLLRDYSPAVRSEAIRAARKVKRIETWGIIAELLDSQMYCNDAASALVAGGNDVLPVINQIFNKTDKTKSALQQVVKIMGKINTNEANDYLWDKLEYPDRKIVREILISLQKSGVQATGNQVSRVSTLLDMELGKGIWNMAALSELKETDYNERLITSLNSEIRSNFEFIYIYLSLLYNPTSIQLVKDNIESGTSEGTTYAIELLDIFVDSELKPKLYPLLDDTSVSEKLFKLQIFFPRITFNEIQTLRYIINRDFNMIGRWSKACAMHSMHSHSTAKITAGLVGHLFNPDLLLAENAASVIRSIDENQFEILLERLPEDRRYYLKNKFRKISSIEEQPSKYRLLYDRVCYFLDNKIFEDIPGLLVSQIVDHVQVVKTKMGSPLRLDKIIGSNPLVIVETGSIEIKGNISTSLVENELFGSFFLDNETFASHEIISTTDSVVYFLDINHFLAVLINFKDQAKETIERIEELDNKRITVTV